WSVFSRFFFCSSRRRHTRSKRDWSSDVCSSDLHQHQAVPPLEDSAEFLASVHDFLRHISPGGGGGGPGGGDDDPDPEGLQLEKQIGRASRRERGATAGAAAGRERRVPRRRQQQS